MTTTLEEKKGLLPSTYNSLVLKQRSLTNVLRKAYHWLNLLNINSTALRNITAEQVFEIVRNIIGVYVNDNKDLFKLFFFYHDSEDLLESLYTASWFSRSKARLAEKLFFFLFLKDIFNV